MELSGQEEACREEQEGGEQWTQPRADGWEIQQAAEERLGVMPTLGSGVPALLGTPEEEWAGGEGGEELRFGPGDASPPATRPPGTGRQIWTSEGSSDNP